MARDNLNVPKPPPPLPPASGWKKEEVPAAEEDEATEVEKARKEDKTTKKSASSSSARTRARTNGQTAETAAKSTAAEIISMLDSVRAHHGHPQLERASTSQRWPVWVIETIAKKSQVEQRPAADIIAETFKRGLANDPYAEYYYGEACERVNARENDWGSGEEDDD